RESARRRPGVTFIDGTGEQPIPDPAPSFFSFIPDSAQQMAGLGDYAFRTLGWRTAITIDDATLGGYGWGQSAAFIGEFCSLGGTIAKRLWIPYGTSDLSDVIGQMPRQGVDGAFLSVVGNNAAFPPVLAPAFAGPRGRIARKVLFGTAALEPTLYRLHRRAIGLVTAGPNLFLPGAVGGAKRAAYTKYLRDFAKTFPGVPSSQIGGFDIPYYDGMEATLQALERIGGDLSDGGRSFRAA